MIFSTKFSIHRLPMLNTNLPDKFFIVEIFLKKVHSFFPLKAGKKIRNEISNFCQPSNKKSVKLLAMYNLQKTLSEPNGFSLRTKPLWSYLIPTDENMQTLSTNSVFPMHVNKIIQVLKISTFKLPTSIPRSAFHDNIWTNLQ